jgi:hypothetical protein
LGVESRYGVIDISVWQPLSAALDDSLVRTMRQRNAAIGED